MKKTYITTMPDHFGAFLIASECFSSLGINITRVSYNKAIDSQTLFIDAEGDEEALLKADAKLTELGYLNSEQKEKSIVLLEFLLVDKPGSVKGVLDVIRQYGLNISYISSEENGTGYQPFKMGLFVESEEQFLAFLADVQDICDVKVIDYNSSEKSFDNSIFYQSFVFGLMCRLGLSKSLQESLLVNSNKIMQMLDEKGLPPYKTFESISRFAELLAKYRGDAFAPRISTHKIAENTEIILIEPPCGSNTTILKSRGEVLFIDCGYALYREEMITLFRKILPDFDKMKKRIFITHADVDHCGLLSLFDEIYASKKTKECLNLEYEGKNDFREQNPLHRPYISICKALTGYKPVEPSRVQAPWDIDGEQEKPLESMGFFDFSEMHFEVFQGKGGHLAGETVLIDYQHHIVFSGDIYINVHGLTGEQAEYNQYAPVLMTCVDTDPLLCAMERNAIVQNLDAGEWKIFGGHGMKKDYTVS